MEQQAQTRLHRISGHLVASGRNAVLGANPTSAGGVAAVAACACIGLEGYRRLATRIHRAPQDLHELIAQAPSTGMRVAVIGVGISGVEAMKCCLAEGLEPVAFEADSDLGGFWRYKDNTDRPSVYRSTHIDTDRDLNGFGDHPWGADKPMLIHHSELLAYLRENVREFDLGRRIRFRTCVSFVTPVGDPGSNQWEVRYLEDGREEEQREIFDCVLVSSGRHGGGAFIPHFPGQEDFKGLICHSSQYKYPEKHGLLGKNVAVVGVGNSGSDIVTELGMINGGGMRNGSGVVVNALRSTTYLVARSGGWVQKAPHMEIASSMVAADRVAGLLDMRLPWWWRNENVEKTMKLDQEQLNRHGLKPAHRKLQQHFIISGLAGQVWLGDQLDQGWIKVRRGIERFTSEGIIFRDADGVPEEKSTPIDAVVFATGYRQQAGYVDPKVVDMRFGREGNDVPLYKGCLPISEYRGLGFINFVQDFAFYGGELQARYLTRVFKGLIEVPPLAEQVKEMEDTRNTLAAQFMDRSQLRVQHGLDMRYYEDLLDSIGCNPSPLRLLCERPTAFWHAYFAIGITPLIGRLVGPGRLEKAEEWIEERYYSRHYGKYQSTGCGYDYNKREGKEKTGPVNRSSWWWPLQTLRSWAQTLNMVLKAKQKGYRVGWPARIADHLEQNLEFARKDEVSHSLRFAEDGTLQGSLGAEVQDGFINSGGSMAPAFTSRL